MTEAVKITYDSEKPTVLGRDLRRALGIKTGYIDWFRRMCEYGFVEGRDFNTLKLERLQRDTDRNLSFEITDHQLTLEMAKGICLIQGSDIGRRCREYLREVERKCNEQVKSPEELILEQARLIVEHGRRLSAVEERLEQLEAEHQDDYYTIPNYAAIRGIKIGITDVSAIGKKAAKLSREHGYDVHTAPHSKFGMIHTYHVDILKQVFDERY